MFTENNLFEKERRTFYCLEHRCFHKYSKNPKSNYQNCLVSFDFYKFKDDMDNFEISRIIFKKNWNQKKANYKRD